jgi:benzoyl-CoA reductase/2-hydroxyglutaryl-CoA dehydratase subunit BcrC/BadD/HgdB
MAEENITSKDLLKKLLSQHYSSAMEAKASGKPVVWSTSIAPQEFLEAMDLTVVYPENHAAAIAARKDAPQFISKSEGDGYSSDICSYARVNIGYADIQHSDAQDIPMPDLIYCCTNICCTVNKWYENLAKKLNIPMIMIDAPFNPTYDVREDNIDFLEQQFKDAIAQLEAFTGRKMDYDHLKEVMQTSNETARWWVEATNMGKHKPSPLSGFDMFNYMGMIVCMRGKKEGRTLFKLWHDELKAKAEAGLGPWKDGTPEKYRILWDGIPCWHSLSPCYKTLKKNGINMVTSTYPESWAIFYEPGDLHDMARAYDAIYTQRNINYAVDRFINLAKNFEIDGAIFHSNRSCKGMDFKQYEIQRRLKEELGVPSVIFDGDMTDPRAFSEAQYETRIQALVETMEENREQKGVNHG